MENIIKKEAGTRQLANNSARLPLVINKNGLHASIEIFNKTMVSGWIALTGQTHAKATIQVLVNSVLRGEYVANQFRSDLRDAGVGEGDGHYAFNIDLGKYAKYFSNSVNSVEFRIAELHTSLFDGSMWYPFDPHSYKPMLGSALGHVLNIYTITFFDLEGNTYYSGGAERYLVDLVELCRSMGFQCKIIQASSGGPWRRYYRDIEVIGVPWNRTSILELSEAFAAVAEPGSRAIFSPFILAAGFCPPGSIGISHGIFWDLDGNSYSQGENHILLHSSLMHLDNLVSVDAATLNFMRAAAPAELTRTNAKVVINYVDGAAFDHALEHQTSKPDKIIAKVRALRAEGKIVFVYPRRLYAARGLDLLIGNAEGLLPEYEDMVILFVGRGDLIDTQKVAKLAKSYPEQVFHTWLEADDMPQAYDVADIVLVPTLHSEGTSLSCIEAMHCGKCVIVTHVGGLPELVIHQFNGLVIEPTNKSLLDAMVLLMGDGELRSRLGANARHVASALSKKAWQGSWKKFLHDCYPDVKDTPPNTSGEASVVFYHPPVPGIELNFMNQRPQALMRDLAILGVHTCFAQDSKAKKIGGELPHSMELISEKAEIFADHTVILCYYPYTLIAYGDEFIKRMSNNDAAVFSKLQQKYAHHLTRQPKLFSKRVSFWFDYLDHKDIHPDKDARALIELGIKYADLLTTSSLLLANAMQSERPDVAYLGNAVSMDWVKAVAPHTSNKSNAAVPILNVDVVQDIVAWRRNGFAIGIYWGALADWNDLSFLAESDQEVRYILVGPVSDSGIRKEIASSIVCTHIDYLAPAELALLAKLADFALIPFKQNSVTHHVNPLKLWEYLALGLPVVARNTGELEAQYTRMSDVERKQVKLIPNEIGLVQAIEQLISQKQLSRLNIAPRTFATEIGPLFKQVRELTGSTQRSVLSEQDLHIWFVPATVQVDGVQVIDTPASGYNSLMLEIATDATIQVAPRWELTPPADSLLNNVSLRLRLNKDVALLKDVRLELFGRNGDQFELISHARPSTKGTISIELAGHAQAFEQICVQLRLPLETLRLQTKRLIRIDWEQFRLEFVH